MRIALLVTDLQPGGTPLRLARLAIGLRARGVDVSVGCLAPPGPVSRRLDQQRIPTFACAARSRFDFRALARLAAELRRIRPDLLHATLTHANVAARLVAPRAGIPVLSSTATIELERWSHLWLERLTARWDQGHLVNSRSLAEHVHRRFHVPRERIHVVPPLAEPLALNLSREEARHALDLTQDTFVVAWAGRMDPVKRLHVLLDTADCVRAEPFAFLLAGDGPQRAALERRLRAQPNPAVRLLRWQDDLSALFAAADVLAFPSLTEGTPNVVLSAMLSGLPVIASDIPSHRELAGEERRILLVEGPRAADWALALREVRGRKLLREALRARASVWARENLAPDAAIEAHLRIYEHLLSPARQ